MKASFHANVKKLINLCYSFLIIKEPENYLLFGILNTLKQNYQAYSDTEFPVLLTVTDDNVLKLIYIR